MAVKVMPLGDSLTAVDNTVLGFKGYLYNALDDAGYDIDYVGSQTATGPVGTLRDGNHEGHPGWQIGADFDNGGTGPGFLTRVGPWVTTYQPDVIIGLVGTNDVWSAVSASTALTRLRTMLTQIFAAKPDVIYVMCHLPPATPSTGPDPAGTPARRTAFNAGLQAEADYWISQGKRVIVAPTGNPALQADGIHLTSPSGHQTVATALYETVRGAIEAATDTPPTNPGGPVTTGTAEVELVNGELVPVSGSGGGTSSGAHNHVEYRLKADPILPGEVTGLPAALTDLTEVISDVADVTASVSARAFKTTTKVTIQWTGLKWSQPRPSVAVCPAGMAEYVSQLHEDAPWPHEDPTSGILAGDIVERHPNAPGPA